MVSSFLASNLIVIDKNSAIKGVGNYNNNKNDIIDEVNIKSF